MDEQKGNGKLDSSQEAALERMIADLKMEENVRLGKYMTAYPISNGARDAWAIKDTSGRYIAYLEWYAPWRQYVMNAESDAVFSHDCLTEISGFCRKLTARFALRRNNATVENRIV